MAWRVIAQTNVTLGAGRTYDLIIDVFVGQTFAEGKGIILDGIYTMGQVEFTPVPGRTYRARWGDYYTQGITSGRASRILEDVSGTNALQVEEEYTPSPPPTPSSITVPSSVRGGESINISWGTSSGATRYHLERRVNSGSWTQIYKGSNRSYTDTITKGWKTVAYRVRAYNSDGYSDYITSPTRTVINFPEMQIKINGVLKTSDAGWVRVNGQLREIDSIYVKVNGQLKEVQ